VLGTVAWTVAADSARAAAARTASPAAASPAAAALRAAAYQHPLTAGFDRAFVVAAGIAAGILVVAIAMISRP